MVCCQHGLQFFPDRRGALAAMRRAVRTGGRLGLAVWADIESCPPFAAVRDAIHDVMGLEAAERYANGPWGLHAPTVLAEMVTSAGFTGVSVEEVRRPVRFEAGANQIVRSLLASGLAPEISSLPSDKRTDLARVVADNLAGLTDKSGAVTSYTTSQIVLGSAR